ncbi:biotin-dependent carboxyltransferase family protein [Microbacteriaceae bacterium VKM Ac-2854]|nr:biotin-dependent carboxyltransferase family protein [Microbacteriaceae bacterium VKM Ac-2854]
MSIRVLDGGLSTLIEDVGRPGFGAVGVGVSGAMDAGSLALANRLVGNGIGAAGLEILGPGLRLLLQADVWFAVTGGRGGVLLDGRSVDGALPRRAESGSVLSFEPVERGLRRYLAVRGGIEAEVELGSRSADTLSGLGPAALGRGDVLALGRPADPVPAIDWMPIDPAGVPPGDVTWLGVLPGPRADWFVADAWPRLLDQPWTVSTQAGRTGIRLAGAPLRRAVSGELASEGMLHGAIQVPPSGLPVIFGPDHPATGGYPVIAVVARRSLDALAHLVPGAPVRFTN